MKAYIITTGAVFGLVTLAHIARMVSENHRLATDPIYLLLTVATAALSVWAFLLVRRLKR